MSGQRQAPEHEAQDLGPHQPVRADRGHRKDRPEQATEPECGAQDPGAPLAHLEELDRRHDGHRIQQPAGHDLPVRPGHRPLEKGLCPDRPDAVPQAEAPAGRPAATRRIGRLFEPESGADDGRDEEDDRRHQGDDRWQPDRHQQGGDERPEERPDSLPGAPDRVRGDQLLGAARDGRHQRDLRGADRRARRGRDRGEDEQQDHGRLVVGHRGPGGRDRERGQGGGDRPDQAQGDEHPVAPEALEQRAREHPRDDGRDHPDGAEQAGRDDATTIEDGHERDDGQRAVSADPQHPRCAEPADALVAEGLAERRASRSDRQLDRRHVETWPLPDGLCDEFGGQRVGHSTGTSRDGEAFPAPNANRASSWIHPDRRRAGPRGCPFSTDARHLEHAANHGPLTGWIGRS